jgi:hypothetical protein
MKNYKYKYTQFHKSALYRQLPQSDRKCYFLSKSLVRLLAETDYTGCKLVSNYFRGYIHLAGSIEGVEGAYIELDKVGEGEPIKMSFILDNIYGVAPGLIDVSPQQLKDMCTFFTKVVIYIQNRKSLVGAKPQVPPRELLECNVSKCSTQNCEYIGDDEPVRHINKESWEVSAHYRMQPCGVKRQDRKLILIKAHKKGTGIKKAPDISTQGST